MARSKGVAGVVRTVDTDDDSCHLALLLMLTCFFTVDSRLAARRRSGANVVAEALPIRDLVPSAAGAGAGIVLVMDTDSRALEHLSPDECMRLMGSVAVGRIVYTRQALPAVELVNFALVDGDIVIRTSAEGKLAAATRGAVVAFEADTVDIGGHADWSVTVVGQARAVSDAEEIGRLERVALTSWVPGSGGHLIRISPAIVNGRRVCDQPLPRP
jgi:hypothetical protein